MHAGLLGRDCFESHPHCAGAGFAAQLSEDPLDVKLYGPRREAKDDRNFSIRLALRDPAKHFRLARCETETPLRRAGHLRRGVASAPATEELPQLRPISFAFPRQTPGGRDVGTQ